MKSLQLILATALSIHCAQAADLYDNGVLRQIKLRDPVSATDTIGGNAIFQGDGQWQFDAGKVNSSTGGANVQSAQLGTIQMSHWEGNDLFAGQIVHANLQQGDGRGWTGEPCGPGHLVMRNMGRGRNGNCMTIDAKMVNVGPTPTTFLAIVITNTGGGGRYYQMILELNPALLGIRDTGLGDWTASVIELNPHQKAILQRVTEWAEKLWAASNVAFGYDKPLDAFAKVPSYKTLLPVPPDLVDGTFSMSFLGVIEDLKRRPVYSAAAYSKTGDYKTRWGNSWGQGSQDGANALALRNCENGRAPDRPPCQLYSLNLSAPTTTLSSGTPASAAVTPADAGQAVEQRLIKLKELKEKGLVSQEQYDQKVKEILGKF